MERDTPIEARQRKTDVVRLLRSCGDELLKDHADSIVQVLLNDADQSTVWLEQLVECEQDVKHLLELLLVRDGLSADTISKRIATIEANRTYRMNRVPSWS